MQCLQDISAFGPGSVGVFVPDPAPDLTEGVLALAFPSMTKCK